MSKTIRIAAALLIEPNGQTLLVRKRGTQAFMQPGGKIDAGEQPAEALARELHEELGLIIEPTDAVYLGLNARNVRLRVFLIASLMTGVLVAISGLIGLRAKRSRNSTISASAAAVSVK